MNYTHKHLKKIKTVLLYRKLALIVITPYFVFGISKYGVSFKIFKV